MPDTAAGEGGLFASAKRFFSRLLGTVETRVELFALELHEEKLRLVEILIWASATIFLAATSLIMLTFMVLLVFWENPTYRLIAMGTMCLLYLSGAVGSGFLLKRKLKTGAKPFASTLGQLYKDRECLKN